MEGVKRATRVAARMQEDLALLVRALSDPRLRGAAIVRVEMTDDLQIARVYVRGSDPSSADADRRSMVRGFEAAKHRIRREIGRSLGLRYTPDLKFFYDEGQDATDRVDALLREIRTDDKNR